MPAGTPKVALFGRALVPGGCQTFNSPGTFTVPVGVSKINLVGKGATGNSGASGNAGNPGGGGAGGLGGSNNITMCVPCCFCGPPTVVNETQPSRSGGVGPASNSTSGSSAVSYTHLTLPTKA